MRGDRKGPNGYGPRTGRGMGLCSGNEQPGYMNETERRRHPNWENINTNSSDEQSAKQENQIAFTNEADGRTGRGMGRGAGRGMGRGTGRGVGRGMGRG
ncbi:MAG: DUF5320 domain-containing protein [Deltaproteobacteria bacterium]|nr:DUF5320 domain-containing protein [Deltaproteobacteria bacterium]